MTSADLVRQVVIEALATLVLAALGAIRHRSRAILDRQDPRLRPLTLVALGLFWFATNLYVLIAGYTAPWVLFIITTFVMLVLEGREVAHLWQVGIHGADVHASKGINPERALALCTNELDFLGTGAWKLTREPGFESAVRRCQRADRPVRFLLLDPRAGEKLLGEAAQRAGFDRDEYRNRVRESLRKLAALRLRSSLNLEVRFYHAVNLFRLMFIDDSLCLASYNVYGEGDGSQLPQVHIVKRQGQRDVETLYYPMKAYFEQIWDAAIAWQPSAWG